MLTDYDSSTMSVAFGVYRKLSRQDQAYVVWFQQHLQDDVISKMTVGADETLRFLSIGGGSGEKDIIILSELLKKYPKIDFTLVEPRLLQIEKFRANIAGQPSLSSINFNLIKATAEEYLETASVENGHYHFISMIHTVYHMTDYSDVIRQLYVNLLSVGGVQFIVVVSDETGGVSALRKNVYQITFTNMLDSTDVVNVLNSHGYKFSTGKVEYSVDGSGMFDKTEEGVVLLNFLCHIENGSDILNGDDCDGFLAFVREHCLEPREGYYIKERDVAFIVEKQQGVK